ncbi:unnamed protein product [Cuscuta epithymum]|uniref:DDE Tnp4 domain-containing protein n=1 Tax=Cuscuta epithymum TaxID=186058 RepID=A0AAV0CDL3_9ASTE|nr:unnamed protein product [Cuscuta epithymum]
MSSRDSELSSSNASSSSTESLSLTKSIFIDDSFDEEADSFVIETGTVQERLFAKCQESARKDVERAFGVLQSRWHIVKGPARMWSATDLGKIMKTCIILHNMIIESEVAEGINPENWRPESDEAVEDVTPEHDFTYLMSKINGRMKEIQDKRVHKDLKRDLINHLWELYGDQGED